MVNYVTDYIYNDWGHSTTYAGKMVNFDYVRVGDPPEVATTLTTTAKKTSFDEIVWIDQYGIRVTTVKEAAIEEIKAQSFY